MPAHMHHHSHNPLTPAAHNIRGQLENQLKCPQGQRRCAGSAVELEQSIHAIRVSSQNKDEIVLVINTADGNLEIHLRRGQRGMKRGKNGRVDLQDTSIFESAQETYQASKNEEILKAVKDYSDVLTARLKDIDFNDPRSRGRKEALLKEYRALIKIAQKSGFLTEKEAKEFLKNSENGSKEDLLAGVHRFSDRIASQCTRAEQKISLLSNIIYTNFCSRLGLSRDNDAETRALTHAVPPPPSLKGFLEQLAGASRRSTGPERTDEEETRIIETSTYKASVEEVIEILKELALQSKKKEGLKKLQDRHAEEREKVVPMVAIAIQRVTGASGADVQLVLNAELVHELAQMGQQGIIDLIARKVEERKFPKKTEEAAVH